MPYDSPALRVLWLVLTLGCAQASPKPHLLDASDDVGRPADAASGADAATSDAGAGMDAAAPDAGNAIECASCEGQSPCSSGACSARKCDGLAGCYPSRDTICQTIAGSACPTNPFYSPCTQDSDCCTPAGSCSAGCFRGICTKICFAPGCNITNCPEPRVCPDAPPEASHVTAECRLASRLDNCGGESPCNIPEVCALHCDGTSTCPFGTTCQSGFCL